MRRETRGSFSDHHRVHRFQLFGFKSMAKNMKKDEKGKVYLSKYYDYDYVERRIFPSQSSSIYIYICNGSTLGLLRKGCFPNYVLQKTNSVLKHGVDMCGRY